MIPNRESQEEEYGTEAKIYHCSIYQNPNPPHTIFTTFHPLKSALFCIFILMGTRYNHTLLATNVRNCKDTTKAIVAEKMGEDAN